MTRASSWSFPWKILRKLCWWTAANHEINCRTVVDWDVRATGSKCGYVERLFSYSREIRHWTPPVLRPVESDTRKIPLEMDLPYSVEQTTCVPNPVLRWVLSDIIAQLERWSAPPSVEEDTWKLGLGGNPDEPFLPSSLNSGGDAATFGFSLLQFVFLPFALHD